MCLVLVQRLLRDGHAGPGAAVFDPVAMNRRTFLARSTADWLDAFDTADIPAAPVNDMTRQQFGLADDAKGVVIAETRAEADDAIDEMTNLKAKNLLTKKH